jgi:hypothetical protein
MVQCFKARVNDMTGTDIVVVEKDLVRSWAADVRAVEYNFFKTVVWALEQFQNKNNGPLARMVAMTEGKKVQGMDTIVGKRMKEHGPAFKNILRHALANTRLTIKEDGTYKFKVGENGGVNADKLEALRMIAAQRITIASDAFKTAFPKPVKEAPAIDAAAACEKARKYLAKLSADTGVSLDVLRHALDAKPTNEVEPNH